jgi:hypothetical protein
LETDRPLDERGSGEAAKDQGDRLVFPEISQAYSGFPIEVVQLEIWSEITDFRSEGIIAMLPIPECSQVPQS